MMINRRAVKNFVIELHPNKDAVRFSSAFFETLEGKLRNAIKSAVGLPSNRKVMRDLYPS